MLCCAVQTFLPLDLRTKQTRAIRRRLTKEQVRNSERMGGVQGAVGREGPSRIPNACPSGTVTQVTAA